MALEAVLETCVYGSASEWDEIERFYAETLELREVQRWPGAVAYRLGDGVLLVFEREALARRDGPIARHGSLGPSHVCLRAAADEYESWRRRLSERGVEITHEESWGDRGRSFYFEDPAANLIEIAGADIWPP